MNICLIGWNKPTPSEWLRARRDMSLCAVRGFTPKGLNAYNTGVHENGSTPMGSHHVSTYKSYTHVIPSGCLGAGQTMPLHAGHGLTPKGLNAYRYDMPSGWLRAYQKTPLNAGHGLTPKGLNAYNTVMNANGSTPMGSHLVSAYKFHTHVIPSGWFTFLYLIQTL